LGIIRLEGVYLGDCAIPDKDDGMLEPALKLFIIYCIISFSLLVPLGILKFSLGV